MTDTPRTLAAEMIADAGAYEALRYTSAAVWHAKTWRARWQGMRVIWAIVRAVV